jgi:hypothetical protein
MSKKPDTASALAGILKAKRGEERSDTSPLPAALPVEPETPPPPSPALPSTPASAEIPNAAMPPSKGRGGKSSDKANYSQYSVYLRKDTRKKVGRALEDAETGQDFSELVQELLEQWLASRT